MTGNSCGRCYGSNVKEWEPGLTWTRVHGAPLHALSEGEGRHVGVGVDALLHVAAPHALGAAAAGALAARRPHGARRPALLGAVVGWGSGWERSAVSCCFIFFFAGAELPEVRSGGTHLVARTGCRWPGWCSSEPSGRWTPPRPGSRRSRRRWARRGATAGWCWWTETCPPSTSRTRWSSWAPPTASPRPCTGRDGAKSVVLETLTVCFLFLEIFTNQRHLDLLIRSSLAHVPVI